MESLNEQRAIVETEGVSPTEAAKNIDRASLFDIENPDNYVDMKSQLDPQADAYERLPKTRMEPVVSEFVAQSKQHRALAAEDLDSLNYFERQANLMGQEIFDKPSINQDIMELNLKQMDDPENFTEGDAEMLRDLNEQRIQMAEEDFGIEGTIEKLPAKVGGVLSEVGRSFYRTKELILGTTAAGATAGGLAGLGIPVPGTTVIGLGAGAAQGMVGGMVLSGFWDGYQSMRANMFNELAYLKDDKGNDLNLDRATKINISHAVGIMGGLAAGTVGYVIGKGNPVMQKFISPKAAAQIVTRPALRAKLNILGYIAKSAAAGGGAGTVAELTKIVGENFAKTEDIGEALSSVVDPKNIERLVEAGIISAGAAATIAGFTGVAGYGSLKAKYQKGIRVTRTDQPRQTMIGDGDTPPPTPPTATQSVEYLNNPVNQSRKVLVVQDRMTRMSNATKNTNVKKFSYGEMSRLKKMLYSTVGLNENVFLHIEDVQQFANTPEKQAIASQIIDPTGKLQNYVEILGDTPVEVNMADFSDYIDEFPELSDYMRLKPDGPNPLEAKNYVERLADTREKGKEILSSLGVGEGMTPEQEAMMSDIVSPVNEARQVFNENEYYDSPTFTDSLEGIYTPKDVEEYNTAQLDARLEVSKLLKQDVERDFTRQNKELFKEINEEQIKQDIANEEVTLSVIENFAAKNIKHDYVKELKMNHAKKGYSPFAIDPDSLLPNVRKRYENDPILKKRKVFVKGGLKVEEAANMLNVSNGNKLLNILATKKDRKQILAARRQKEIDLKNQLEQAFKPDKIEAFDNAFTKQSLIHRREMKFMKDQRWSQTKKGIKRIASPTPRIEEINAVAVELIGATQIKNINPNKFAVGERKSQRKAVNHILNNEVFEAFKAKERAIYNNELTREAYRAKQDIYKIQRVIKRIKTPEGQATLKEAGYLDAYNEIADVFRLDTSSRGLAKQGAYDKFVKEQVELGNGDFTIPEKFDNPQESARELTVDQYRAIGYRLEALYHQAKMKNKLMRKYDKIEGLQSVEAIAEKIHNELLNHPSYNPKKSQRQLPNTFSWLEEKANVFSTALSSLTNIKNLIAELDQEQLDGLFHRLMSKPLKDARTGKRNEMYEIAKHDKAMVEKYGLTKFKEAFNDFRFIEEFQDIPSLGNGNLRKTHLMVLQAYMGDPDGRAKVINYRNTNNEQMTYEVVQSVLDRELDEADVAFVQNYLVNRFNRYGQRSVDLEKRTNGTDVNLIKGVEFVHRGKVYPGGYYPHQHQFIPDERRIQKELESIMKHAGNLMSGTDEGSFFARLRSAEMTDQGRLQERNGSDRPLDLDFNNVYEFEEQILHDLHFREWGIDTFKMLKNPVIANDMKNVLGTKKFSFLINSIKDTISKTSEKEVVLYSEQYQGVNKAVQTVHSLHAVKTIGANLSSSLIQFDSLKNLPIRFGGKTAKYIGKSASKLLSNPVMFDEFTKIAEEINPDIKFERDNIDSAIIKSSYDYVPGYQPFFKNYKKGAQKVSSIRDLQKKMIDLSFGPVRTVDRINKVIVTLALSEQFSNGEIEGYPLSRIEKMSNKEQAETLRSITQQAIDLTLTASAPEDKTALEKNKISALFMRYYTDRRSSFNSALSRGRRIRSQLGEAAEGFREGNKGKFAKGAKGAMGGFATWALAAGASRLWIDMIRGNEVPLIEDVTKIKNDDDFVDYMIDSTWYFASSPISETLDTIPWIDGIKYSATRKQRSDYRTVSVPFYGVMGDIAMGYAALNDALSMAVKGKGSLSKLDRKALLTNGGYLLGGAPTNAIWKGYEFLNGREVSRVTRNTSNLMKDLNKNINMFIDRFKDDPDAQVFINDLKEYQQNVLGAFAEDVKEVLPENINESMEALTSEGDWTKYNEDTGAAGIYQFTEERWNEIKLAAPELALTDNGRVSKDSTQQRKAMKWSLEDTARGLQLYEIPVNERTLYGVHKFGFDNFVAIEQAAGDEELSKVLGKQVENDPLFKGLKTVKSVKSHISSKVSKLEKN